MCAATTWTVEGALEEVADAIDDGALILKLDAATKDALKAEYRSDFQNEHAKNTDWNAEKGKILYLCNLIGSYATLCTVKPTANPLAILTGGYLDRECVLLAAEFMAKVICPRHKLDFIFTGKWCHKLRHLQPGRLGGELASAAADMAERDKQIRRRP